MSGHTDFTAWVAYKAKHVFVKGKKHEVASTFFTSAPGPNNDEFNIKLANGKVVTLSEVDEELFNRFHKRKRK